MFLLVFVCSQGMGVCIPACTWAGVCIPACTWAGVCIPACTWEGCVDMGCVWTCAHCWSSCAPPARNRISCQLYTVCPYVQISFCIRMISLVEYTQLKNNLVWRWFPSFESNDVLFGNVSIEMATLSAITSHHLISQNVWFFYKLHFQLI